MVKRRTIDDLIDEIGIDETFTKPTRKEKEFTRIKDVMTPIENFNYMADLLHLPTTKNGYKYLFVITDLITHEFDIEPIKNKESKTILKAMQNVFKRNYLKKPKASIRTDNGTEFKEVFHKWLVDNKIFHSVSLPYRHSQLSAVEALNKQLGRIFNGYMNMKEEKTQRPYNEWDDIIDFVRKELNDIRYTKAPYTEKTINKADFPFVDISKEPLFKVGELVHRRLNYPQNALGKDQPTETFRMGDYRYERNPRKITRILYYNGKIPYRYMLDGIKTTSYTENQLMRSKEKITKFVVKKIIGKKKVGNKIYYHIWWKDYPKKDATWEPKSELIIDIPLLIQEYEKELKKK